jgi:hypothetical protein
VGTGNLEIQPYFFGTESLRLNALLAPEANKINALTIVFTVKKFDCNGVFVKLKHETLRVVVVEKNIIKSDILHSVVADSILNNSRNQHFYYVEDVERRKELKQEMIHLSITNNVLTQSTAFYAEI